MYSYSNAIDYSCDNTGIFHDNSIYTTAVDDLAPSVRLSSEEMILSM